MRFCVDVPSSIRVLLPSLEVDKSIRLAGGQDLAGVDLQIRAEQKDAFLLQNVSILAINA